MAPDTIQTTSGENNVPYDLSGLDPSEIAELKAALGGLDQGPAPGMPGMPGMAEVIEAIKELDRRTQGHETKLADIGRRFDAHHRWFTNDFLGGLTKLHEDNARSEGIKGLQGKYSADFEPHAAYLKTQLPEGTDFFGSLHDNLKSHWDDEGFDPDDAIDSVLEQIEDHIAALREAIGEKIGDTEDDEPDEEEPAGEPGEEDEPIDFSEEISRLRQNPAMRQQNAG